ncbi:MAG: hypothetical protein Q8K78_09435 [Planctomycetaceae bacterium]|nr:hypothetical protein [Planctomycetaceae bacterium]
MNSESTTSYWEKFWSLGMVTHATEVAALMFEILIAISVLATPAALFLWLLGF